MPKEPLESELPRIQWSPYCEGEVIKTVVIPGLKQRLHAGPAGTGSVCFLDLPVHSFCVILEDTGFRGIRGGILRVPSKQWIWRKSYLVCT